MSHLSAERALELSIELEQLLADLGATSWGLGSRATELRPELGERLYEDLRYVAWARNKVAHEDPRFLQAEERRKFELAVSSCRSALLKLTGNDTQLEAHDVIATARNLERLMHAQQMAGNSLRERATRAQERLGRDLCARILYVAAIRERYLKSGQPPLTGEERDRFIAAAEDAARDVALIKRR